MLKTFHPETLFEFIPEIEKVNGKKWEEENPGKKYQPLTILHVQFTGDAYVTYTNRQQDFIKQKQVQKGIGKNAVTEIDNTLSLPELLKLNKQYAKSLIKKVKGFELDLGHEKIVYPVPGKEGVEWCTDEAIIEKVVDMLSMWSDENSGTILGEFINYAQDLSKLTPAEKKS